MSVKHGQNKPFTVPHNLFDFEEWKPLLKQLDKFGWHLELHCEGVRIGSVVESLSKYFIRLFEQLGPDRLMRGSDWPWTRFEDGQTYEDTLKWHDNWIEAVSKTTL